MPIDPFSLVGAFFSATSIYLKLKDDYNVKEEKEALFKLLVESNDTLLLIKNVHTSFQSFMYTRYDTYQKGLGEVNTEEKAKKWEQFYETILIDLTKNNLNDYYNTFAIDKNKEEFISESEEKFHSISDKHSSTKKRLNKFVGHYYNMLVRMSSFFQKVKEIQKSNKELGEHITKHSMDPEFRWDMNFTLLEADLSMQTLIDIQSDFITIYKFKS